MLFSFLKVISLWLIFTTAAAPFVTPWGKDGEMACDAPVAAKNHDAGVFDPLFDFYRSRISIIDYQRCSFRPSCSSYMRQAIAQHGALKGFLLGLDRLMRCSKEEWYYDVVCQEGQNFKFDPVP